MNQTASILQDMEEKAIEEVTERRGRVRHIRKAERDSERKGGSDRGREREGGRDRDGRREAERQRQRPISVKNIIYIAYSKVGCNNTNKIIEIKRRRSKDNDENPTDLHNEKERKKFLMAEIH